jgi:hypothetical protein
MGTLKGYVVDRQPQLQSQGLLPFGRLAQVVSGTLIILGLIGKNISASSFLFFLLIFSKTL